MRNPIHNAIVEISKRDLVKCKRCGCPDLAWVTFKSGKKGLVETATQRPMWRGDGPAPVGLFALKFNFHKCETYKAIVDEIERRARECHPKASNPAEILSDAMSPIIRQIYADGSEAAGKILLDDTHPLKQAFDILLKAQSSVRNLIQEMNQHGKK